MTTPHDGVDPRLAADARRRAGDSRWWDGLGACMGMDPDLFFPVDDDGEELPYPTSEAAAACQRCEVRGECLMWVLARPDERGTWGGLSAYQRRQVRRVRPRVSCPGCGTRSIVAVSGHEVCVACGVSWAAVA